MASQPPETRTAELCVVGDFAWDVLVKTDTELRRGGDTFGDVRLTPGGSAANVAVWATRCGTATHFVGKIGTDRLGELAREDLEQEGVAHTLALSRTRRTGSVAVLLDHDGERSMVSGFGADFYLEPDEIPIEVVAAARHTHLTAWSLFNDPPRTAAMLAARAARDGGGTLSLDPASFQMIDEFGTSAFLEMVSGLHIDLFMPNYEEGKVLSGESDPERIASVLAEQFPDCLIVLKLDADGVLIRDGGGVVTRLDAAPGTLVDATGAGDSFAGAFLARWLAGDEPATAAGFAARVASWVIGERGARPACPAELVRPAGAG